MKSTKENHPREDAATAAKAMGTEIDPVYINPLTDFGFKKLFCSDRRGAERLLALLRAFLPDKMEGVTDITFLPSELLGESEEEVFRGLFEDGRHSKLTVMEKKAYRKSVLEYADVQDAIRCAREISLKEGIEQGIEQGFEQGIEQGIEKGREEGRAEGQRELIKNLLASGLDISTISKATGLSEEEIENMTQESV